MVRGLMAEWIVERIDAGCDCCTFVPVAVFDSEQEAKDFTDGDSNYLITKLDED